MHSSSVTLQHRQGNNPFVSETSSPTLFNVYLVLMKTIESKPVMRLLHLQKDRKGGILSDLN
jgi:hypothetical protein